MKICLLISFFIYISSIKLELQAELKNQNMIKMVSKEKQNFETTRLEPVEISRYINFNFYPIKLGKEDSTMYITSKKPEYIKSDYKCKKYVQKKNLNLYF